MKWIKITADMFDNRKIKQIESLPGGDSIIVVWVKLLCLAGTINDDGRVYLTPEIPYTDEMLSTQFNKPTKTIRLALDTFEKFGMIDVSDSFICVTNWGTYQNVDGLAKVREQTRKRVQKHREKKAIEQREGDTENALQVTNDNATENVTVTDCNVTSSVTVTESNATDKNKNKIREEIEEDKKQKREKKSKKEKADDIPQPPYYPNDEKLDNAFCEYLEYRKRIKKPLLTKSGFTRAFNDLEKASTVNGVMDNDLAVKVIEQSIFKCYVGLFPVKDNQNNNYQQAGKTNKQGIDFDALREKYKGE